MQKVAGFVVFSALKSSFQISEKAAIEVVCESSPCILSVVMKSTQHVKTKLIPLNSEGNFSFCILAWIGLMLMVNKGSIIKGWLQFVQIWCGTLGKKHKTKHKTNKQKKNLNKTVWKRKKEILWKISFHTSQVIQRFDQWSWTRAGFGRIIELCYSLPINWTQTAIFKQFRASWRVAGAPQRSPAWEEEDMQPFFPVRPNTCLQNFASEYSHSITGWGRQKSL